MSSKDVLFTDAFYFADANQQGCCYKRPSSFIIGSIFSSVVLLTIFFVVKSANFALL